MTERLEFTRREPASEKDGRLSSSRMSRLLGWFAPAERVEIVNDEASSVAPEPVSAPPPRHAPRSRQAQWRP